MDVDDNFYIHLNSNISEDLLVDSCGNVTCSGDETSTNRIGNFKNRLARRLALRGEWEVSLTNIEYMKSWFNIFEDQMLYLVDQNKSITYKLTEKFPKGNYVSPEEIIGKLNKIYSDFINYDLETTDFIDYPPSFEYDNFSNKIRIRVGEKRITGDQENRYLIPKLSHYLRKYLGLVDDWGFQYPEANKFITSKPSELQQIIIKNSGLYGEVTNNSNKLFKRETVVDETRQPSVSNIAISNSEPQGVIKSGIILSEQSVNDIIPIEPTTINNGDHVIKTILDSVTDTVKLIDVKNIVPGSNKQTIQTDSIEAINDNNKRVQIEIPVENGDQSGIKSDEPNSLQYKTKYKPKYFEGFNVVDLHGPIDTLYIYCSLIKPVLIANVEAQMIRRVGVPSDKKFGVLCEREYQSKEYYPLLCNEFDTIEIDIKSDSGKTVDFEFGKVALTLHFRKRFKYVL